MHLPTGQPLLSPHGSLVSCLVREAKASNTIPLTGASSLTGAWHLGPRNTRSHRHFPPSAPLLRGKLPALSPHCPRTAPGRAAPLLGVAGSEAAAGRPAWRPSPHRHRGKSPPFPAGQSLPAPLSASQSLPSSEPPASQSLSEAFSGRRALLAVTDKRVTPGAASARGPVPAGAGGLVSGICEEPQNPPHVRPSPVWGEPWKLSGSPQEQLRGLTQTLGNVLQVPHARSPVENVES